MKESVAFLETAEIDETTVEIVEFVMREKDLIIVEVALKEREGELDVIRIFLESVVTELCLGTFTVTETLFEIAFWKSENKISLWNASCFCSTFFSFTFLFYGIKRLRRSSKVGMDRKKTQNLFKMFIVLEERRTANKKKLSVCFICYFWE